MELGEYDHRAVEAAGWELWESHDIYRYDSDGNGPVFSDAMPDGLTGRLALSLP